MTESTTNQIHGNVHVHGAVIQVGTVNGNVYVSGALSSQPVATLVLFVVARAISISH